MARVISHADAAELLGAYALDAVELDEIEAIEAHLETCPRCRDELRAHREVVGVLAYAGQDAPEGLWDRVAARIHDPSEAGGEADAASPTLALRLMSSGRSTAPVARPRPTRWIGAAMAAAVVIVALMGVQVYRLENRTNHLSGEVAAMTDQPSLGSVHSALATPGAHVVQLRAPTGNTAELDAVILPSGAGYLYSSHLSPLSSARTYQLWGVVGNQVISYGVLGSALPGVESFRASPGVSSLAVTDEVAGGVVSSTQQPVAVGAVAQPGGLRGQ
jgi:anti-sigma factor RsiW